MRFMAAFLFFGVLVLNCRNKPKSEPNTYKKTYNLYRQLTANSTMQAKKIADIIITYFESKGDLVTNKKLQKLLYYIEAWFLVYSRSIIDEDFEAWVHGPVIPSLYREYKRFGYSPIEGTYKAGETSTGKYFQLLKSAGLNSDQKKLLFAILDKYAPLPSYQLEALSHSEDPWKNARLKCKKFEHCNEVIEKSKMKKYYSSLVSKK